ncbi:MAG: indole-3-glycerol phosphate synthase TrpC [Candidatus Omnitrophica bacterium]|nr:indole-3-glycerol phosphate synthase TrpC [Candidatus Omnitrophota bacterium]
MKDFLKEIVDHKKSLLNERKAFFDGLRNNIKNAQLTRYSLFKKNISNPGQINLIAEIKKASPSKGVICKELDVIKLARVYQDEGAAAISVITEEKFFLGGYVNLKKVVDNFNVPVLAKDFFIDEAQVYEAFSYGASAVLLIVAILEDDQIRRLMDVARQLDMDSLVEVHDKNELDRALDAGAEIIGINNRNLHTFEVDLKTSQELIPRIPKDKVVVAESGIKTHDNVKMLQESGANAVLIGETFLREQDVGAKIKDVMGG